MTATRAGESDETSLARLGYKQELTRAMGGFASFALSFSIISVLTGVVTTYGVALQGGGAAGLGIGWPLVCFGTLLVALAMGELASAFPTAGALYHWSALLGGPGWGWFTAMMNLVGQVSIVAAVDLGCAQELAGALGLSKTAHMPLLAAILVSHAVINIVSVKLVARLNDFSATVHVVGVLVLVGLLLAIGRVHGASFLVDTSFTAREDGVYPLGFANALMLGMYTFTGYDASAHVSEETHDPARRAPWGIVSSVVVSAVAGYALVVALTLAIRDVPATAASDHPALFVLDGALGASWGPRAMGLAIAAMWFCGLSAVTSASRTLFAFSRDGGVPFSAAFRAVSSRLRTPHVAILAMSALPLVLVVVANAIGDAVFNVVVAMATTGLYVSYGLPLFLGARARARGVLRHRGPWHLGRASQAVAWLASAWCVLVVVVSVLPPNTAAGIALAITVSLVVALWFLRARGRFVGPKIDLATFEGAAITPATKTASGASAA